MTAYYNEVDPAAAAALRALIADKFIAPGDVDERSIEDVSPADLLGYTQCHFFAGQGVWSYALRLAGWPDDRQVWTGSCPCQPFSAAGKGKGTSDERHLWPHFLRLIEGCRPAVVFGEQTSSASVIGRAGRKTMHPLWRYQTGLAILENRIERAISECLQELPKCGGPAVASGSEIKHCNQGKQAGSWCQGQSRIEGSPLRFDARMGAGEPRPRDLRGDGLAVRYGGVSGLEHSLSGQENPFGGLHPEQHQSCSVRCQCSLRGLGRGPNEGRRSCHLADANTQIKRAIEENRRAIEDSDGSAWIDLVQFDLERARYTFGACISPAAGIGAPHIRERLYWMAHANDAGLEGWRQPGRERAAERPAGAGGLAGGMDDSTGARHIRPIEGTERNSRDEARLRVSGEGRRFSGLADDQLQQRPIATGLGADPRGWQQEPAAASGLRRNSRPGPTNSVWRDADWLGCRDGKWRPVEPGTFPLAHGATARVGQLRLHGNAIVAQQAQAFIESYIEMMEAAE